MTCDVPVNDVSGGEANDWMNGTPVRVVCILLQQSNKIIELIFTCL